MNAAKKFVQMVEAEADSVLTDMHEAYWCDGEPKDARQDLLDVLEREARYAERKEYWSGLLSRANAIDADDLNTALKAWIERIDDVDRDSWA